MKYLTEENLTEDAITLEASVKRIRHRLKLNDNYNIDVLIKQQNNERAWAYARVSDIYFELINYSKYFDTIDEAKEHLDLVVQMLMNNKDSKLFK